MSNLNPQMPAQGGTDMVWSTSEDGETHYLHKGLVLIACVIKLDHCWLAKGWYNNDPMGGIVSLGKHVNLDEAKAECEAPWPADETPPQPPVVFTLEEGVTCTDVQDEKMVLTLDIFPGDAPTATLYVTTVRQGDGISAALYNGHYYRLEGKRYDYPAAGSVDPKMWELHADTLLPLIQRVCDGWTLAFDERKGNNRGQLDDDASEAMDGLLEYFRGGVADLSAPADFMLNEIAAWELGDWLHGDYDVSGKDMWKAAMMDGVYLIGIDGPEDIDKWLEENRPAPEVA